MLSNFKQLFNISSKISKKCELNNNVVNNKIINVLKCVLPDQQKQNFITYPPRNKYSDILEYRKSQKQAIHKLDITSEFEGDINKMRKEGYFPTVDLPDTMFNNVPFKSLPVVNIRVSRNNTIMSLSSQGVTKLIRSCGMDGFKNAKKGTNVAAQTTGTAFGKRAIKKGFKTVRVVIEGLGPGRTSSLKGLQLGGLDVVSITDNTTDYTTQRPRKQRRL